MSGCKGICVPVDWFRQQAAIADRVEAGLAAKGRMNRSPASSNLNQLIACLPTSNVGTLLLGRLTAGVAASSSGAPPGGGYTRTSPGVVSWKRTR